MSHIRALVFFLLLEISAAASDLMDGAGELHPPYTPETNSPEELLPATMEPGLSERAVPMLPPDALPEPPMSFYRVKVMQDIKVARPLPMPDEPDPSSFRSSLTYYPPIGLQPRIFRTGLLEFYPWFGLAQSFESNVNLTATNPIADFYLTPRLGVEWQLGTPDSKYNEFYDTILAMNGRYEAWSDLFYRHPGLSTFSQEIRVAGRVGRSAAIWRPAFSFSDITGSNLLLSELVNRTQRLRTNGELVGQYQFTSQLGANQTFGYFRLVLPDPGYINATVFRTRQELTWKALDQVRVTAWADYRHTDPSKGSSGSEVIPGIGFYGKPDPRWFAEIRVGWDFLELDGTVPGRRNLPAYRFNGWTTFDWSSRLRLTFRFDRDYVFNEQDVNDNYVSTLLQVRGEMFLGGNWYITPYLGCSLQEFETSNRLSIQLRPELEVAYALPGIYYPGDSKFFVKIGYMNSSTLRGEDDPVENWRISTGINCKF